MLCCFHHVNKTCWDTSTEPKMPHLGPEGNENSSCCVDTTTATAGKTGSCSPHLPLSNPDDISQPPWQLGGHINEVWPRMWTDVM